MKILVVLVFIILSSQAFAEGQTILPMHKNFSKMNPLDFVDALKMVREVAPDPTFVSFWGWERLEPDEGEFNVSTEVGGIKYAIDNGFKPYIGITVIDTVRRVLPDDLSEVNWNAPVLLERYDEILKKMAAELPKDLKYFVIANEADFYFDQHQNEFEPFITFVENAKKRVKYYFPHANVGVSVTFEGMNIKGNRSAIVKKLIELSDAAFFTYYPQVNMVFFPPSSTPKNLDMMIAAAQGKAVLLQEVGYPSAGKGITPQTQAEFFKVIIPEIDARSQIKLASIFGLHDMDKKFCDGLANYYGFSGLFFLTDAGKNFQQFLCNLGLRDSDGNPKPAWLSTVEAYQKIKPRIPK